MPAFLKKLTAHIYDQWKERLGELCIVLPNRRASVYMKGYLSGIIERTSILPDFFSIEDFVAHCSGRGISDQLGDQFRLYDIHRRLEGERARSIEEFFPYAAWMMSDFNEIDMYLIDQEQLFGYLSDARAMALWNPDGRPLTDFQKRYLGFYRSLKDYYAGLNSMLEKQNQYYQGMAFRSVAGRIEEISALWRWEKVIFAGFNALTPAEQKIIGTLLRTGKAAVFWDADKYYTGQKEQEAGLFLRKHFREMNQDTPLWVGDHFSEDKDIHVIGVPRNIGQVKYAGEIIQKISRREENLDNTALVLADESLLIPLLSSIPGEAGKFNVTMGLALKNAPVFNLLDNILGMMQNAGRFMACRDKSRMAYYFRDIEKVLGHPWSVMLSGDEKAILPVLDEIRTGNRIFIPASVITKLLENNGAKVLAGLFPPTTIRVPEAISLLSQLILSLREKMINLRKKGSYDYATELEYLFRFNKLLQRLDGIVRAFGTISDLKALRMVFRQLSSQQRIPFRGEPLQGLQVMGVLETRTLDFDRVIMLSVNEGTLPAARMPASFIPYDIRQEFGLPTYRHNDAVFGYHFYRLLQRAKEVYLLYDTEAGDLGGGEKSRFIKQLQHEGPAYHKGIRISEKLLTVPPLNLVRPVPVIVEKDAHVMNLLNREAVKGFHPSSLSLFINCPLQFYLTRLLGIVETEEMAETIDARTLGTVAHESLKAILFQYTGKVIGKKEFEVFSRQVDEEVRRQFGLYYHEDDISFGKNYLIVQVTVNMLKQLFEREASWVGQQGLLKILALEKTYFADLDMQPPLPGKVNFRGTIDRIDESSGMVRILDYKTGSVQPGKLKPGSWEALFTDPEFSQAFQLMMYSWLYHRNHPVAESRAGILSLRAPGTGPLMMTPPDSQDFVAEVYRDFEEGLGRLVSDIFDPSKPFIQAEDEKRCRYCNFRDACNRQV